VKKPPDGYPDQATAQRVALRLLKGFTEQPFECLSYWESARVMEADFTNPDYYPEADVLTSPLGGAFVVRFRARAYLVHRDNAAPRVGIEGASDCRWGAFFDFGFAFANSCLLRFRRVPTG
jgi:hypothetical protein